MIFLAKGICTLGSRRVDADGNIVEEKPSKFEINPKGGSVAVGVLDDDTMQQIGKAEIFGDFDPAGYLSWALHLLAPNRPGNIPDFKSIVLKMREESHEESCPFLSSCEQGKCCDCIVAEWIAIEKEQAE